MTQLELLKEIRESKLRQLDELEMEIDRLAREIEKLEEKEN